MEGSSKPRTPSPTPGDGSVRKSRGKGSNVDGKTVKITVQMQNTKDVTFNIKRNAPLGKLMLNYCLELGLNYKAFKFTYLGKQVKDCETPLDLQMEEIFSRDAKSNVQIGFEISNELTN
uniref:Rad60/SUMO-like domain-containing protein n=1 Tax=Chenopodium quinoa TaxID=63459 RepID=A0A803N9W5_CHEQI